MGVLTNDESEPVGGAAGAAPGTGRPGEGEPAPDLAAAAVLADAVHPRPAAEDADSDDSAGRRPGSGTGPGDSDRRAEARATDAPDAETRTEPQAEPAVRAPSRRPPALTQDTARPEGGGRAAPGDASAPARQWPLLTVLALAGLGLVVVGTDAFADAFRVGTILIGAALITGAVMRRVLPSVGMLAVRSRFTDMVTYGLLGTGIVLIALVTQPKPWLDIPFLEDAVHFTVR